MIDDQCTTGMIEELMLSQDLINVNYHVRTPVFIADSNGWLEFSIIDII